VARTRIHPLPIGDSGSTAKLIVVPAVCVRKERMKFAAFFGQATCVSTGLA
jgi:hypothetical protein